LKAPPARASRPSSGAFTRTTWRCVDDAVL
jgi:hypothetical protein